MPGYHFKENDYLHIMQSYNRIFEPNHVMPRIHRHVGIEIMYVLSGKAIVRMYDEAGAQTEQYKLSSGDFFFLESDRFHQLFTSDCVTRIVNLELAPAKEQQFAYQRTVGQIIKGNRRLADLFSESQTFRLFDNGELLYILMMILRRFPDRAEKYGELEALLVVLFAEVADLYRQSERQYRGYAYVKRAVNEIENDVSVCTPDSLAETVGVSRVYLQKLFRLCFSMGVAEYINYFRCTRARYTKSDWLLWCAALTDDPARRDALYKPVVRYLAESTSRVPFGDWYDADSGRIENFVNRTVQGGVFAPLLKEVFGKEEK